MTSYRIDALTKENYDTWSLQAQAILIKNGLWEIACGSETPPSKEDEKAKYTQKDLLARSELLLLISPSELKQVKNCKTSYELWDKLKSIYQSTGPARKATLLKQLILKKVENNDVREHLNNFMDIVDKLADMNVDLHPDLLSIMMLYSLPASYENFRIAVETRDSLPKPEELKIKIIEESEARKNNDSEKSDGAFFSKKNTKYCQKCKKKGHTTEACWGKQKPNNTNKKQENTKQGNIFNVCLNTSKPDTTEEVWCLDSGCSSHICGDSKSFTNITSQTGTLNLASKNHTMAIEGKGQVTMIGKEFDFHMTDTLYVPDLTTNLLSVGKITDKGNKVLFEKNKASIIGDDNKVLQTANRKNGLYYVEFESPSETANHTLGTDGKTMQWHQKLGHVNEKDLRKMVKDNLIYGIDLDIDKLDQCETCIKGKFARLPFPTHDGIKTNEPLQIVHSDVCGPFECESLAGSKYYVTFIDDYTRYSFVYFMERKNQVFEKFKEYKNEVENFTNKKIKNLQTDNGKEYINREFDEYLKKEGIRRRLTAPYTPQQNGLSERKNRSLMEKARCLMIEANTPKNLWAEAVFTANYLINRSPAKALNGELPYKKWVGRTPSANHLHIFGSKAFALIKNRKGKLAQKAKEGMFVGYAKYTKGYRIYIPEENAVINSRDVKVMNKMYYEDEMGDYDDFVEKPQQKLQQQPEPKKNKNKNKIRQLEITERTNNNVLSEKLPTNIRHQDVEHEMSIDQTSSPIEPPAVDDEDIYEDAPEDGTSSLKSHREKKQPSWLNDFVTGSELDESFLALDASYISDEKENGEDWNDAIKSEIKAHLKNGTWKIIKKETDMKLVDYKMILKKKIGPDNKEKKKARLVARGFTQRPGIDFNETFAPVAKLSSIRSVIGMAVEENLQLNQMDVTTAYLNGDLEENIVMKLPDYVEQYLREILVEESVADDLNIYNKARDMLNDIKTIEGEKVCQLKKALYGLKQAGRQWYTKLDTELKNIGFTASLADPCVYIFVKGGVKIVIAIYFDDILTAYSCPKKMQEIKEILN